MRRLLFVLLCVFVFVGVTTVPSEAFASSSSVSSKQTVSPEFPLSESGMRPVVSPGVAILFNFFPLLGFGVGSLLQGDLWGAATLFGATVTGGLMGIIGLAGFGLTLDSGNPAALTFFLVGSALVTFSMVWSVLAPLRYARYLQRQRALRKRESQGLWSRTQPLPSTTPLLHTRF